MPITKYSHGPEDEEPRRGDEDDDEASQATHEPTGGPGDEWDDTPNYPDM